MTKQIVDIAKRKSIVSDCYNIIIEYLEATKEIVEL